MSFDKCVHQGSHCCAKDLGHLLYPTKFPCPIGLLLQAITELTSSALALQCF